jgi:predicted membrane protein (TIGR00267 family)
MNLGEMREWWRELDEVTDLGPIVRRYFVIGAFDGALTVLGIVIGVSATLGDHPSAGAFVVAVSVSASIALAISSAVGAYEAERVEKKLHRHSIERAMLVELSQEHRSAFRTAALVSAVVHGVAPVLAALVPVVPFVLTDFRTATIAATVMTLGFLFGLGAYLGSLVRERIVITGLRFVATGLGTAAILWALGALGLQAIP